MVYTRNQPVASDDLDISQPFLVNNTNGADDSFGVDHYKFSDLTANNGFHNQVTTVAYVSIPPGTPDPVTPAAIVRLYAKQITVPVGVLQYSRGPNSAVPSPVTTLQSPNASITLAPGASTNVLDCTGLVRAYMTLIASDVSTPGTIIETLITFNGTNFDKNFPGTLLTTTFIGNVITLKNNTTSPMTGVYWILRFHRLQL